MRSSESGRGIAYAMPLLAFAVMVAYVPGVPGFWAAGRWALLATVGVFLPFLITVRRMTDLHKIGTGFVLWAGLSFLWCVIAYDWANETMRLLMLAAIFLVAAEMRSLKPTWIGLILGVWVNAAIALVQWHYQWFGVFEAVLGAPAGLLGNKNFLAEIGAVALIAALGLRLWWLVPGAAVAALLPLSVGTLVGLAAAGCYWLWGVSRAAGIAAVALLSIGVAADLTGYIGGTVEIPVREITTHHFSCSAGDDVHCLVPEQQAALHERWEIWLDMVDGLTVLGRGWGQFYVTFPEHSTRTNADWFHLGEISYYTQPDQAHNEYLQILFELGPVGLALFLAFIAVALHGPVTTERAVLVALLVQSLASFPLHLPATGFAFALAAGGIAGARSRLRQLRSAGGISLWDGVRRGAGDPNYGAGYQRQER